ncbi:MAG: hypothetical protein AAFX76_08860 [Planctomycetota bacterium]
MFGVIFLLSCVVGLYVLLVPGLEPEADPVAFIVRLAIRASLGIAFLVYALNGRSSDEADREPASVASAPASPASSGRPYF